MSLIRKRGGCVLFWLSVLFAEEQWVLSYNQTLILKESFQKSIFKEYFAPQKYCLEQEGVWHIIREDQQLLLWLPFARIPNDLSPEERKIWRAERTFKDQQNLQQQWENKQKRQQLEWEQSFKEKALSQNEQQTLQQLHASKQIFPYEFRYKEKHEHGFQNLTVAIYEILYKKEIVGEVRVLPEITLPYHPPHQLLHSAWNPFARIKEAFSSPICSLTLSLGEGGISEKRIEWELVSLEKQSSSFPPFDP